MTPTTCLLSPVRAFAVSLVATMALATAIAPQASAFRNVGEFAASGADGVLHHQQHLAVEHSTGNVLRTDVIGDQVIVYAPNGTGADQIATFGSGELSDPYGIAVDQANGDVYVSDAGNGRIVRYATDGQAAPTYTLDGAYDGPAQGNGAGEIGSFAAAIALDPTSGKLLVADPVNDLVKRYDTTGAYDGFSIDGAGSPSTFTRLLDLAVDSAGDVIVVDSDGGDPADGASSRVERFDADGSWAATIGPVDNAANVAVRPFNDEVIVSGNQDAVNDGQPEFPTLFAFDTWGSAQFPLGGPTSYSTVSGIALDDGQAGQMFVATDTSRGGYPTGYGRVSVQVYDAPVAPAVVPPAASASELTSKSAKLHATVDPGGARTTYRFEYGPTAAYGSSTSDVTVAAGYAPVAASADLTGLDPATTYHFRVVVDNGVGGPVVGPDRTFTTLDPLPTVAVGQATGIGTSSATVHGSVDTHGVAASYRFHVVQTDGPHSRASADIGLDPVDGPQDVSAVLSDLPPGGSYAVRLSATSGGGTEYTGQTEFSTASLPSFVPEPLAFVGSVAYGCKSPRLDAYDRKVRPGQRIVLTGSDLGAYGTVAVGGGRAEVSDYSSSRIAIEVPSGASGSLLVTVNCGKATNAIALAVAKAPSNRFQLDLGKAAMLRVKVPGRGTLSVRGSGVRSVVKRAGRKGTARIQLTLTKAGRTQLARSRSGKLRREITIRYRPVGGSARTVSRTITFTRGG